MTGEINWVNANEYLPVKIALTIEAYDRASEEVSKRLALI
jgi:hypothetical protein